MSLRGVEAVMTVESATDGDVFLAYQEQVLCPSGETWRRGQAVAACRQSVHRPKQCNRRSPKPSRPLPAITLPRSSGTADIGHSNRANALELPYRRCSFYLQHLANVATGSCRRLANAHGNLFCTNEKSGRS
jgi:hypothetical protein